MLNDRKVRLMTKLALYETNEGKEDIKLSKYYKTDYARLQVLKTALCVTLAYILLIALYVIYNLEYFIADAVIIEWGALGKKALGIYLAIMTVYIITTLLAYSIKYTLSRKKLSKYFRLLRSLKALYNEDENTTPLSAANEEDFIVTEDNQMYAEELKKELRSLELEETKRY